MKKRKLLTSFLICTTLLLTACGGGEGNASSEKEPAKKDSSGKYSPTLTITAAKQSDENAGKYDSGDDVNKNPMIKLGEDKLGIKIDTTLLGGDAGNYNQKLRLALTGSEQLPDVVPVYDTQLIADLIESKQVKAIDEDIEKYMPARLKEIYDKYPETFYPVTKDGKTYGFANSPVLDDPQVLIIRQDWLDKLNLKAPTTMEEFEAVCKAFTEQDPDGNGKKDTYGFTYAGDGLYNTGWVADPVMLFSANSGEMYPGTWQKDESGKLQYGSTNEGNKKTLEKMADWHKKGYLFQEAAATGAWDAMTQFTEGKAGMFMGRPWAIGSVADVEKNIEGAKIVGYPTIRQDNGEPTYQNSAVNDGWFMFNKDFNNMEAFFDYYNWLYDVAFGTGDFKYGYVPEYDYEEVDGKVVFDAAKFKDPKDSSAIFVPSKSIITKNRPYVDRQKQYFDVAEGKTPETGDELRAEEMKETNPAQFDAYVISYKEKDSAIPNLFNGEPTSTMKKSWEQLQTLEKQTYTNIIYGKADISAFDDFVKQWKDGGGDKITEEVNAWYESVQ